MKQENESATCDVQTKEQYEAPQLEVIAMEVEGPILAGSGVGGEDSRPTPWRY